MGRCCGGGAGARKIARQQLDEVMGRDRNRALTEQQRRASHFSDNEFCKFYLVGFCPYSLFTNTKSDLGVCTKNHSESMRAMWDRIPAIDKASYRYEDDMQTFLEDSVRQVDKIISARKNASAEKEAQILPDAELTRARGELEARIVILEQEQDEYNDDGRFEEARKAMETIVVIQEEIKRKNKEIEDMMQREKIRVLGVCDICGVKIELADDSADARHLVGKQHVGYEMIRSKMSELEGDQNNRRELRREFREQNERSDREKEKEKRERPEGGDSEKDRSSKDEGDRSRDYNRYRY